VDVIRGDVVEDSLVVRDEQHPEVGPDELVDPRRHRLQRVDVESRIGLVENGDLRFENGQLERLHPLLLSAGEALVHVAANHVIVHADDAHLLREPLPEHQRRELRLLIPGGVVRGAQEVHHRYARDLDGILKGEEESLPGAFVGRHPQDALAVEQDVSTGHHVPGAAHHRVGEGRFSRPIGPHQRVDFPLTHREVHAREDLLSLYGDPKVLDL
jgi:hypothetical protein